MAYCILENDNDFICSICCCVLQDPIDCQKCNISFCRKCIEQIIQNNKEKNKEDVCPLCNEKWNPVENKEFRNLLIKSLKFRCPKCKYCFKSEKDFDIHRVKCKKYKCKICHEQLEYEDFIKHLMINHKQIIMKNFDENSTQKIKKNPKSSNMITSNYSGNKIQSGKDYEIINYKDGEYINYWKLDKEIQFPNEEIKNGKNFNLASNNLYYCGKTTNLDCGCCDGKCKEGNCLCINCMELNKQMKNLNYYYLINKQGRAANLDNGKFRCRYKYDCIENINGNKMEIKTQCKFPNNPCPACQVLNKIYKKYFNEIKF